MPKEKILKLHLHTKNNKTIIFTNVPYIQNTVLFVFNFFFNINKKMECFRKVFIIPLLFVWGIYLILSHIEVGINFWCDLEGVNLETII